MLDGVERLRFYSLKQRQLTDLTLYDTEALRHWQDAGRVAARPTAIWTVQYADRDTHSGRPQVAILYQLWSGAYQRRLQGRGL